MRWLAGRASRQRGRHAYLARAASQAGSNLILWRPGQRDVDLLREFRRQQEQSAGVCATLLEVFDGWPAGE